MREGNLEAPTRHPLDWQNPEYYDEAGASTSWSASSTSATAAAAASACAARFPTLFDLVDDEQRRRGRRRRQGGLLEGRRPVLPVRHVLHDQVSVRAAASVERRFPAPDAARQGGQVQATARSRLRDKLLSQHRRARQARRHPGRRAGRQRGEQDSRLRARRWRRCSASHSDAWLPAVRGAHVPRSARADRRHCRCSDGARTPGKVAIFATCYVNYNEPGIGHDLLQGPRRTTRFRTSLVEKEACCGMPKLELGDLEAVASAEGSQHPASARHWRARATRS